MFFYFFYKKKKLQDFLNSVWIYNLSFPFCLVCFFLPCVNFHPFSLNIFLPFVNSWSEVYLFTFFFKKKYVLYEILKGPHCYGSELNMKCTRKDSKIINFRELSWVTIFPVCLICLCTPPTFVNFIDDKFVIIVLATRKGFIQRLKLFINSL